MCFQFAEFVPELITGRDAVRPFLVDQPSKIYDESNIDVDAMFSLAKSVRSSPQNGKTTNSLQF